MSAPTTITGCTRVYLGVACEDLDDEDVVSALRQSKYVLFQSVPHEASAGVLDFSKLTTDEAFHNWFELGGRGKSGRWALKLDSQNDDTHKTFIVTKLGDDSLGVFSLHEGTQHQVPKDAICLKSKAGSCKSATEDSDFDQVDLDVLNTITMGIKLYDECGQEGSLGSPPLAGSVGTLDGLDETLLLQIPGSPTPISSVFTRGTASLAKPTVVPYPQTAPTRITFEPSHAPTEESAEPTEA